MITDLQVEFALRKLNDLPPIMKGEYFKSSEGQALIKAVKGSAQYRVWQQKQAKNKGTDAPSRQKTQEEEEHEANGHKNTQKLMDIDNDWIKEGHDGHHPHYLAVKNAKGFAHDDSAVHGDMHHKRMDHTRLTPTDKVGGEEGEDTDVNDVDIVTHHDDNNTEDPHTSHTTKFKLGDETLYQYKHGPETPSAIHQAHVKEGLKRVSGLFKEEDEDKQAREEETEASVSSSKKTSKEDSDKVPSKKSDSKKPEAKKVEKKEPAKAEKSY